MARRISFTVTMLTGNPELGGEFAQADLKSWLEAQMEKMSGLQPTVELAGKDMIISERVKQVELFLFYNNVRTKFLDLCQDHTTEQAVDILVDSPVWRRDFMALVEAAVEKLKLNDQELLREIANAKEYYKQCDAEYDEEPWMGHDGIDCSRESSEDGPMCRQAEWDARREACYE